MVSVTSQAETQTMGTHYARACSWQSTASNGAARASRFEQGLKKKEIQGIPTERLFPNPNGSERNYNLSLMILNLYLIHLAVIVGRYCT